MSGVLCLTLLRALEVLRIYVTLIVSLLLLLDTVYTIYGSVTFNVTVYTHTHRHLHRTTPTTQAPHVGRQMIRTPGPITTG